MDEVTIQKIAAEVVRHLPSYAWLVLLVQAVIMAAAAAAGAFFGEYLKTRGKKSLQDQLRANTELVETIKSEAGQRDWAQREWTNLRRTKLEALLEKMHDCEAHLDRLRNAAFSGEEFDERDPFSELDTIGVVYFPELRSYAYDFVKEGRTQAAAALKFRQVRVSTHNKEAIQQASNEYSARWKDNEAKLIQASHALKSAARRLLVSIMGVDEHP